MSQKRILQILLKQKGYTEEYLECVTGFFLVKKGMGIIFSGTYLTVLDWLMKQQNATPSYQLIPSDSNINTNANTHSNTR